MNLFDSHINSITNNIEQQQLRQRLGYSQTLTNPQAAQNALQELTLSDEQSGLGETGRQLTGNLAPGTLYQYPNIAGNLMESFRGGM